MAYYLEPTQYMLNGDGRPVPNNNNINNGILFAPKAVPKIMQSSAADGGFSTDRHSYVETVKSGMANKKWYGNRDASQVTQNRRVQSIGNGTMNANGGAFSLSAKQNNNTVVDALVRVRRIGYCAPRKKPTGSSGVPMGKQPSMRDIYGDKWHDW
jgi:hypothetical protein